MSLRSMVWALVWVCLGLQAAPLHAGVALGIEYANVDRDVEIFGLDFNDDASGVAAAFIGFELKRSMFYLKYQDESSTATNDNLSFDLDYNRTETTAEWIWNDSTDESSAGNVSVGLLYTEYDIGSNLGSGSQAEMFGLSVGGGGTKYLGNRLFLVGSAKIKFLLADDEDLFSTPDDDEASGFFGYEAKAGIGISFGETAPVSVQFGLKLQAIDFEDRFIDDESFAGYVAVRIFIPTGSQ